MSFIRHQPNYWAHDLEKELLPFLSSCFSPEQNINVQSWSPRVDVKEEQGQYLVHVDLPGVDPKDIDIEMDGHTLTIRGERKIEREEKKDSYYRIERASGKFCRQFSLPETVNSDGIQAKAVQGVLTIVLPKMTEQKTRKIMIES